MKIFFLSDDFPPESFGGAGIVAFNFAQKLRTLGNNISVITTVSDKEKEGLVEYKGIRVFKIYSSYHERWRAYLSLYNPTVVGKVRKILNEEKPDIVHAHNIHYHLSYYCLKIAKHVGARVFLTAHDVMLFHYGKLVEFINSNNLSIPEKFNYKISAWQQIQKYKKRYNPFRNIIIRYYLKNVDKIFAVSGELKEALIQNGIKNIEVVHNGISVDDWDVRNEEIQKFKAKYKLNNKKIVLFGGRLSGAKGGGQAILTIKEVVGELPGVTLLIIGKKNIYANEMLEKAKKDGVDKELVFTGWISGNELKSAYQSCDVLIMPSICFDTFGMVCLEAMACKKPVVATCFGGSKEVVMDSKSGFIVNPFNTELMAEKIIKLLKNPKEVQEFGSAGYERAKKDFNETALTEKMVLWYNKFLI